MRGLEALVLNWDDYPYYMWKDSRSFGAGVVRHDPDKAFDGLTLFTSAHAQKALLMTMDGKVVHEWGLPYSALWDDTADVANPAPDNYIHVRELYLYPNGDLLAIYVAPGHTPWGYGLVKFDKDSNVIWKYLRNVHHDVDVAEDGRIFTLTHAIREEPLPGLEFLKAPLLEDFVAILTPDGEEIARFSLVEALRDSPFGTMLAGMSLGKDGDVLHANALDVVDADLAANLPMAEPGQILVSFRSLDVIALVDVDARTVTWTLRGPWHMQHDPDILPDGNMLIFDNLGHYGPGGRTRIIEFNPVTGGVTWIYAGNDREVLETTRLGEQQRLPNGNTLITETYNGRIVEVTRQGEIAWEYISPFKNPENPAQVAIISSAERFAADWFEFPFAGAAGVPE